MQKYIILITYINYWLLDSILCICNVYKVTFFFFIEPQTRLKANCTDIELA